MSDRYDSVMLENITNKIKFGRYTVKKKEGKHAGQYYNVLRDVYDEELNRLPNLFYCSECEHLINHVPARETAPLNRHANECHMKNKSQTTPANSNQYDQKNEKDREIETISPSASSSENLDQCSQVMNQ